MLLSFFVSLNSHISLEINLCFATVNICLKLAFATVVTSTVVAYSTKRRYASVTLFVMVLDMRVNGAAANLIWAKVCAAFKVANKRLGVLASAVHILKLERYRED